MGIPVVIVSPLNRVFFCGYSNGAVRSQAPSEAEAQCAELARGGKVNSIWSLVDLFQPALRRCLRLGQKIWIRSHLVPQFCSDI